MVDVWRRRSEAVKVEAFADCVLKKWAVTAQGALKEIYWAAASLLVQVTCRPVTLTAHPVFGTWP